jgi:WD40 repeat protein
MFAKKLWAAAIVLSAMVAGGLGAGLGARWVWGHDPSGAPVAAVAQAKGDHQPGAATVAQGTQPKEGPKRGEARTASAESVPSRRDSKVRPDLAGWRLHATLAGHQRAVHALTFSPDGARVASVGDDGRVRVWDVARQKEWLTLSGPRGRPLRSVALDRSGNLVAAGNVDGTVLVWDPRRGQDAEATFTGLARDVQALRFDADRPTPAWARCDGVVGSQPGGTLTLPGSAGHVHGVTISADGRTVAWGMKNGSVGLLDLAERKQRGQFRVHTSEVWCLTFSPDGRTAASADHFATLKVWDTATGRPQATARGHRGHVRAVGLASGGQLLASGGDDHTVRVWDA